MKEIEINGTCDVLTDKGVCGEKVTPEIAISNGTSFSNGETCTKYYNRYHTYWKCEKHGAVPAIVNGENTIKPEDILGRFENENDA